MSQLPPGIGLLLEVVRVLRAEGVEPLLIGAAALAYHGYPRSTEDADFAVAISPNRLRELTSKLPDVAEYEAPSPTDPLGGVTTVIRDGGKVQIVNFDNSPSGGFPALVKDALGRSVDKSHGVPVPTLEDLILFKAYAGGFKSRLDVGELLVRTRPDLDELRQRADEYGLRKDLEYVLGLGG